MSDIEIILEPHDEFNHEPDIASNIISISPIKFC